MRQKKKGGSCGNSELCLWSVHQKSKSSNNYDYLGRLFISFFAGAAHAVIRAESSGAWSGSGLSNACDKENAVAQTTSSCRLSCHLSYHPAACVTFLRQFYSRSVATFFLSSFLWSSFLSSCSTCYILRQLHSQSVVTNLLLVVFLVVLNMQESLVFAKTSLERMISAPSFYPLCRTSCATLIGNAMRLI